MGTTAEEAVDTYIAIATEHDPQKRAEMLATCWAEDGRLVVHGGRTIQGRAALLAMYERVFADPNIVGVRVLAKDVRGTTFRFRYATDLKDGSAVEAFDAGEVDASGRISTLLVFNGPAI
jgi:hypothetical protein